MLNVSRFLCRLDFRQLFWSFERARRAERLSQQFQMCESITAVLVDSCASITRWLLWLNRRAGAGRQLSFHRASSEQVKTWTIARRYACQSRRNAPDLRYVTRQLLSIRQLWSSRPVISQLLTLIGTTLTASVLVWEMFVRISFNGCSLATAACSLHMD